MKRLALLLLPLLGATAASADERSLQEKRAAAAAVLCPKAGATRSAHLRIEPLRTLRAVTVMGDARAGGFAVVANDDAYPAVVGYSTGAPFDADALPCGLAWWLEAMDEALASRAVTASDMSRIAAERGLPASVPALVSATWGQYAPFNQLCPATASGDLPPCGCVATATAQLMHCHRWPVRGTGSHAYTWTRDDGRQLTVSADFGATAYAWDQMLDAYSQYSPDQAEPVARLVADIGVAVEMQYGPDASGAYISDATRALYQYFGYHGDSQMRYRYGTDDATWAALVMTELAAGRPILYSGTRPSGASHAFLIDGYDAATGMVHVNWGWDGGNNGMYNIDLLQPFELASGGYSEDQAMAIGLAPAGTELGYPAYIYSSSDGIYADGLSGYFIESVYSGTSRPLRGRLVILMDYPTGWTETIASITTDSLCGDVWLYLTPYVAHDRDTMPDGVYRVRSAFFDEEQGEWIPIQYKMHQTCEVRLTKRGDEVTAEPLLPTTIENPVAAPVRTDVVRVYTPGGRLVLQERADRFNPDQLPGRGVYLIRQGATTRKLLRK